MTQHGHPSECQQVERLNEHAELLIDGARFGDMEDIQMALDNRADVDSADGMGRTGWG